MWSWKYRKSRFAGPWRANSTFLTTSHLDKNVELHIFIRGGIGLTRRLGAGLPHPECLNERMDTLPRTRASHEPIGYHRGMKTLGDHLWVLFDAQAACVFSCSASKRSSFFQSVNVMAAILRASVRRAISGFIPLASKPV